jgi:hypothetical protein
MSHFIAVAVQRNDKADSFDHCRRGHHDDLHNLVFLTLNTKKYIGETPALNL